METLDTTGMLCPVPIIMLTDRIEKIPPGEKLKIISDDPAIEEDIINWCKGYKNELVSIDKNLDDNYEIVIIKNTGYAPRVIPAKAGIQKSTDISTLNWIPDRGPE